jgi:hypothetical protein
MQLQFHILSFEGPDLYARCGGLATRVQGLVGALVGLGFETHLWFIGDPEQPGHESRGRLHLHRWTQWVSRHHPGGVYDGEVGKQSEYTRTLPPFLLEQVLRPHLQRGANAVVLAEEWHTADAALHLDWLLAQAGLRDRVALLWNANNNFGFERIDFARLAQATTITTVSCYMKRQMGERASTRWSCPMVFPPRRSTRRIRWPVPSCGAVSAIAPWWPRWPAGIRTSAGSARWRRWRE